MKKIQLYIITVIIGIGLINCTKTKPSIEESSTSQQEEVYSNNDLIRVSKIQFENESMKLANIEEHSFGSKITATGMLDVPPNGRAVISAQIGGYIKDSPLLVGDQVRKGQLLLTMENIEFIQLQQEYLEATEHLVFLKSDFERQKELFDEKITSEKSYLRAKSSYQKTLAVSKGLMRKLELLNIDPKMVEKGNLTSIAKIYAPISGNITDINVKTGSHVSPAEEIMEIVNTDHMHLELKIFVQDILKIKKGQTIYFRLPESHSKRYTGEVYLIGKSIQGDRTVKLHAHIDESDKEGFIPGMYVQATIITDEIVGPAISEEAILQIDDKAYLLVLQSEDKENYVFKKLPVSTGPDDDQMILIQSEQKLDLSSKYLVGTYNLTDGF